MKHYYYLGIQTDSGMVFVTSLNSTTKQFAYDIKKMPLAFSSEDETADLVEDLLMNFVPAVVVSSPIEIKRHFVSLETVKDTLLEEPKIKALGLDTTDDFYIVFEDIECIDICEPKNGEDRVIGRYSFVKGDFVETEEK